MKHKYGLLFLFVSVALVLQSFTDPYINLKKRITDKQFKYEFYTTDKTVRAKSNIVYYWFKGGSIHSSQEGVSGELLNDLFEKFYLNNQLAEKGKFNKGKKNGLWRSWHPNGVLASEVEWAGGQKNGKYISFNENGEQVEKGYYRVDKKQGKWINYLKNDTISYKNDKIVVKKIKKEKKTNHVKKVKEEKEVEKEVEKNNKELKNKDEKKEVIKEKESIQNKKNIKSTNKTQIDVKNQPSVAKKQSFFSKLFSKKSKNKKTDVKGS